MKYTEFNQNIKDGNIRSLYLFQGEENFVKQRSLGRLIEAVVGDGVDWNLSVFDEGMTEDAIYAASQALPMMGDRRLVVIKDCPALLSRGGDMPLLAQLVQEIPSTTVLVFYMRQKADGKRKLAKALKEYAVEFPALSEREITQYLRVDAKQHGCSYDRGVMERLLFYVGKDMGTLVSEAGKLYALQPPNGLITLPMVEGIVTRNTTANVFSMMDAAVKGNIQEAASRLEQLFVEGEAPIGILGAMGYRIRVLLAGRSAVEEGLPLGEAAKRIPGPRFVAEQAMREGRRYSEGTLVSALQAVGEAEYAIKSGRMGDRQAVKNALMKGFGEGPGQRKTAK